MTSPISLKNIPNYQTFLNKRNIFNLASKSKLWEMEEDIDKYLNYVAGKFPLTSIPEKLKELKNKNQTKLEQAIKDFDREEIKLILINILKDSILVDSLKAEAQKQVDELFKKTAPLNFHQIEERTIRRFKGKIRRGPQYGTDEIMFMTYFLGEEMFLNYIPAELQKELEKNPRTNFSRIDQTKWNTHRDKLLFEAFDNFPYELTKEADLADIEKEINKVYPQFLELIREVKNSQNGKPDELQTGGSSQGGTSQQGQAELEQITQSEISGMSISQRRAHIIKKIEDYVRKHNISVDEALGGDNFWKDHGTYGINKVKEQDLTWNGNCFLGYAYYWEILKQAQTENPNLSTELRKKLFEIEKWSKKDKSQHPEASALLDALRSFGAPISETKNYWERFQEYVNRAKAIETELGKLDQDRQDALTKDPKTSTNWNPPLTEGEKTVINDPNLNTKEAIQAAARLLSILRSIQKDNGGSENLTEWDGIEKVYKAIQTFQKDHYDNLGPYQQAATEVNSDRGKAWKSVNAKLNKVAENVYQRYSDLNKLQTQLTQQKEFNQAILEAIIQINQTREVSDLVSLSEQKKILGENWEKNLANQSSQTAIQEQRKKLVNPLEKAQVDQKEKRKEFETQIQEKIDKANQSRNPKEQRDLLNDFQLFIDNWGLSRQADLAQRVAFHSKQTDLLKAMQKLENELWRREIVQMIDETLKDPTFLLSANDLSQNEYRNYPQTLQNYKERQPAMQFGIKVINDICTIRSINLHSQHQIKEGENAHSTKKNSLIPLANLVQHRASPANSQERDVMVRLSNQINSLTNKLVELERQETTKRVKQWLEEQKVSEEDLNKKLGADYQNYINRAGAQDLLEKRTEDRLKKTIAQVAQQQQQPNQRSLIIEKGGGNY